MLQRKFVEFFVLTVLAYANGISAQGSSSITPSNLSAPSMQSLPPLPKQQQQKTQNAPPTEVVRRPIAPPVPVTATYLHPGILVFSNGRWEGSDHLLNLTNNIGVTVSVLKPKEANIEITDAQIKKAVEDIFKAANINPQTIVPKGEAPLPFFEIEILAYPIEKGYAIAIDGRLFESVFLDRFHMDPEMAFQAVTWEKKTLQVGPANNIGDQILRSVQDIASSFTDRYKAYEEIRKTMVR